MYGEKMNILITGGAGYLGSILTEHLLQCGHKVRILDCFLYGRQGLNKLLSHKNLTVIDGNICNILDIVHAVKEIDVVIALAAIVGDPACNLNDEDTLNTNFESTKILIDSCKYYNVRRIIFASSCSVYGSADSVLTEESPLTPLSLYAKTRVMSEQIITQNNKTLETIILRFATLFGYSDRMRFDLVANIFSAHAANNQKLIVYGGQQCRPLLHVKDAARCIALASEADSTAAGHIFNVGGDLLNYKVKDIAEHIASCEPGCTVEFNENSDERNYHVSFSKIQNMLGFVPQKTVEDGFFEIKSALRNGHIKNYRDDIYYNVKYLHK